MDWITRLDSIPPNHQEIGIPDAEPMSPAVLANHKFGKTGVFRTTATV